MSQIKSYIYENEEEMEEREWVINGFKTFSAVAQEYFPEYSNADTASKRMRNEIELDKLLFDELKAAHYVHETTRFFCVFGGVRMQ